MHASLTLAGMFNEFGFLQLIILCVIGLLIFGKRLPEMGKSLGKGIVEFKKGLGGVEDDINNAGTSSPRASQNAGGALPPAAGKPTLPESSAADTQQQLREAQDAIRQLREELRDVKQSAQQKHE